MCTTITCTSKPEFYRFEAFHIWIMPFTQQQPAFKSEVGRVVLQIAGLTQQGPSPRP